MTLCCRITIRCYITVLSHDHEILRHSTGVKSQDTFSSENRLCMGPSTQLPYYTRADDEDPIPEIPNPHHTQIHAYDPHVTFNDA